jgi:hypothetical protein
MRGGGFSRLRLYVDKFITKDTRSAAVILFPLLYLDFLLVSSSLYLSGYQCIMRYQSTLAVAAALSVTNAHSIFVQLEAGGTQYSKDSLEVVRMQYAKLYKISVMRFVTQVMMAYVTSHGACSD